MSDQDYDEPNFFEYLRGVPEVAALIADRIYEGRIPQHVFDSEEGVMDCAVYQRAGSSGRGVGFCSSDSLVPGQYQLDIYSLDSVRKAQVARAIRRALVDYSGPMGAVLVNKVLIETDFDSQEEEPGLERRTQTYTVWYWEG
jgi:hypothetical protein